MQATPQTSTTAIVSLVFGILSWIALPLVGGLIAVITGHLARAEIRRESGRIEGDGLAVAGLVLGYLNLSLALVALLIVLAVFAGLLTLGFMVG